MTVQRKSQKSESSRNRGILRLILDSGAGLGDKITLSILIIIYIFSLVGFEFRIVKKEAST